MRFMVISLVVYFLQIFGSNRPAAMSAVFLLSAVFHEYILSVAFGFFYPVLFVMFAGAGCEFLATCVQSIYLISIINRLQ